VSANCSCRRTNKIS